MTRSKFFLFAMLCVPLHAFAACNGDCMPTDKETQAVNWATPSKQDLVERALSDGMTDPTQIAAWAKNYKVDMSADEVAQIKAGLGH